MNKTPPPNYDAFFISPDVDPVDAVELGVSWLVEQPGEPLILLYAKKMIDNNRLLAEAAARHRIAYEAPRTISNSSWTRGPILAPWANSEVIHCIDDRLRRRATAVCVIGWNDDDPDHAAWTAARNAVDLVSGCSLKRRPDELIGDPVVRIALDHAETFVNHNNRLVSPDDKAYAIRTLQELLRGGHIFNVDEVAAYAMTTGWSGIEIERLREYGRKLLDGGSFRLQSPVGPKTGACRHWEAEAAEAARRTSR